MARFTYKVRDGQGELATGVVQAATIEEASQLLRGDGKFIVKLDKTRDDAHPEEGARRSAPRGRIKRDDVITFAHQMAVMVDTGVPISEALECIADQASNEAFRDVLRDVTDQVQAGNDLSSALEAYPRVFPTVMTSLVRASEISGTMGAMLERVSRYMQKEAQTVKKIRGAMTYPCVMVGMVIAVTVFLLVFVMPRFAGIYQSRGASLPGPTQLLLALSELIINYWWGWIGGAMLLLASFMLFIRTSIGRRSVDLFKLKAPVIGPLFSRLYITRGCRTMGTMISAGVPILDMITVVRQVTNNVFYEDMWDDVDDRLRQGAQLSNALFASPLIPKTVSQMIYAGEKAGRLSNVMERIADFTEEDFDESVKKATQFIEPALIAVMGGIIGFVAIAMLLPIFSVSKVVSGQ